MSIAILVDGSYTETIDATAEDAEDGETVIRTYQPRSEDELAQIATLVRLAVGFDSDRGDTLEVINMQFQEPEPFETELLSKVDGAVKSCWPMACLYRSLRFGEEYLPVSALLVDKT